jgi:transcription factor SPN1
MLAPVITSNRARPAGLPASYTVAPRSTFDGNRGPDHRPIGAGGLEAFRKMTQKGKGSRR